MNERTHIQLQCVRQHGRPKTAFLPNLFFSIAPSEANEGKHHHDTAQNGQQKLQSMRNDTPERQYAMEDKRVRLPPKTKGRQILIGVNVSLSM